MLNDPVKTLAIDQATILRLIAAATCVALVAGCATGPAAREAPDIAAAHALREARSIHLSTEARVAHYLDAASLTAPRLGSGTEPTPAREIYNAAAGGADHHTANRGWRSVVESSAYGHGGADDLSPPTSIRCAGGLVAGLLHFVRGRQESQREAESNRRVKIFNREWAAL